MRSYARFIKQEQLKQNAADSKYQVALACSSCLKMSELRSQHYKFKENANSKYVASLALWQRVLGESAFQFTLPFTGKKTATLMLQPTLFISVAA